VVVAPAPQALQFLGWRAVVAVPARISHIATATTRPKTVMAPKADRPILVDRL
jgi:hypothetical protein